jgi:broad specificity phosphatase PhoE
MGQGGGAAIGAVILVRHGRPALSRRRLLSSRGYRAWWAEYEAGGLRADQVTPQTLKDAAREAGAIIASSRPRSVETALAVGEGRDFISDALFMEAPLPPPKWPEWIRLPPMLWGFISRVAWWFFDHHHGEESRRQAETRAETAAARLVDLAGEGRDVLVLAHGFFNTMIGRALERRGWRCTVDGGWRYWSARRFERQKTPERSAFPAALALG